MKKYHRNNTILKVKRPMANKLSCTYAFTY